MMRNWCVLPFVLLGGLACTGAPAPSSARTSAQHPLRGEHVRWPALRRACAAQDKTCREGTFSPHEREALTLVEFWSPHCPPCKQRLAELSQREAELWARGAFLELIAVLEPEEPDSLVNDTLRNWQLERSSWILSQQDAERLRIAGLPSLWLVSSRSQLLWVARARSTFEDVIAALETAH
jgi:thiol-disulfide isomerase/thioredoxin